MTELLQYISIYGVQFPIIEFDPETFRILLDYLHTGSCPLTCCNIPGLICAAEHYDLPELLQACFHHAKQFLRIEVVSIYYIMSHCQYTDILQYPMSHLCSRAMWSSSVTDGCFQHAMQFLKIRVMCTYQFMSPCQSTDMLHNPRIHLYNTVLWPSSITTGLPTPFEAVL